MAMHKPSKRRFLLWGTMDDDTVDEIRGILELAGGRARMSEIPFDYTVSYDDIIEAIEDVYDGDEDVRKVVDIKAVAQKLGDTKSDAWEDFDDATKSLVQDALADWIEESKPELEEDFPSLFEDED